MSARIRRLVVFVGATGVLAVAGCGGATPSSSPSSAQGAADQPQQQQGAQGPGGGTRDLSALADKLGVSTAQLQKAMQAAGPPSPGAAGQNESDRIAALAKALGLSEAKVQAAIQATRPSGAPQGQPSQPPQSGQSAA